MLWMMLQQTTSINDWCSSRGTSIVQTLTRTQAYRQKEKKKKKKILQVALVTEAIVASLSAQTLTFI